MAARVSKPRRIVELRQRRVIDHAEHADRIARAVDDAERVLLAVGEEAVVDAVFVVGVLVGVVPRP